MKLREKTLLIIGIILVGMVLGLYFSSQIIMRGSFEKLEEDYSRQNIDRALFSLNEQIDKIDSTVVDWAQWDDTYEFVEDLKDDYILSNVVYGSFVNNRVNLMLFYNSSGGIIFGKAFDIETGQEIPVPVHFQNLSSSDILLQHIDLKINYKGLVLLPEGPMLISSRPIMKSDRTGPFRGTLIMGRFLNSKEIEHLSAVTKLPITIYRFDDSGLPLDLRKAQSRLSLDSPIILSPLNDDTISGYALIKDVYGTPRLILRTEMPRGIYQQGLATERYFIILLLGIGLLFGAVTLFLLEKSVLSRLSYLGNNVSKIGMSKNPSERVTIGGEDELSGLANDINSMLESLEQSQKELRRSENKNQALLDAIPDMIFQMRRDGTIYNYKATKDENLYISPAIFIGRRLDEVLPKDIANLSMENISNAIKTKQTQTFHYQLVVGGNVRDYEARIVISGEDEIIAIVTDISEHKKAEEARKNELLLKEIHHRIKNNLQVISSLLYLQSRDIKYPEILEMFKESQHRVKSMALAHEKLYQSKEIARIEFGEYIQDLAHYLFQTYRINSNAIKLDLDVENIYINMDTAIPCGLIVNELITNSLKHAFPEGRTGEIKISFHSENTRLLLSVGDDGVGIPEKLDFRNTDSLGLKLVTTLIEQIDGTIELDTKNGTKFNMIFIELKNGEVL